jgi:hypothetical protein
MEDDFITAMLSVLQDGTPAEVARRAVRVLSNAYRCPCAAAFLEERGFLKMLSGSGIDQSAIDAVNELWSTSRRRLVSGNIVLRTTSAMLPLMAEGELVGVVYLRSDRPLSAIPEQQAGPICTLLAKLCRTPMDAPEAQISTLFPEDLERERLIACLETHEWNIARVARAMGVTRPTVYARMERLKIERKYIRVKAGYALRQKP